MALPFGANGDPQLVFTSHSGVKWQTPRGLNLIHDKPSISDHSFDEPTLLQTTIKTPVNHQRTHLTPHKMPKSGQPERKPGRGPVKLACLSWCVVIFGLKIRWNIVHTDKTFHSRVSRIRCDGDQPCHGVRKRHNFGLLVSFILSTC